MSKINLTNKLSLLIILAVVCAVGTLGYYFDIFLQDEYFKNTKKRMQHGYERLISDITNKESDLKKSIAFTQSDEGMLASIELINNYQDRENYNAILLDEEKKSIAKQLLSRVKLSLNDNIVLYDKNDEAIACVIKESDGYHQHFVSYEEGKKILYKKHENDQQYVKGECIDHPLINFKHIYNNTLERIKDQSVITHHFVENQFYLRVHHTILNEESNTSLAHIEMSSLFGVNYFSSLSKDLDMNISATKEEKYGTNAKMLFDYRALEGMNITQTQDNYLSTLSISSQEGVVYIVAQLNKALLKSTLDESRKQLMLLVVLVIVVALAILRFLFNKGLATPLDNLMNQIKKIEKMDYSRSKIVHTGDELEMISKNINQLALTIREREKALHDSKENLKFLSNHDPLTNLPNRRLFSQKLEDAIVNADRERTKVAVLFLDLDHFKEINDTLGHNVGDELLVEVSNRLKVYMSEENLLARIGGDEFNILIEHIKDISSVQIVVENLLASFNVPFICDGNEIKTTISIGISLFPDDAREMVSLIKYADLAMYKSKAKGRNGYSFFSSELSINIQERTTYINALKYAIENSDEFFLLYQPKVSLVKKKMVALEALVRWNSSKLGFMSPDKFIHLAEDTNMIIPIGKWILERACSNFMQLLRSGCALEQISINISTIQLLHSDMFATLEEVIQKSGILPHQIELEITESYIATNEKEALMSLKKFREIGISLAIDDFGTGYSSMSYLKELPVTRLKIDKSFVDDLPYSKESVAIAKVIISLAKTFDLSITAEGVENQEQVDFLELLECDEIQGYFYSKPLKLEDIKSFHANMNRSDTNIILKD